MLVTALQGIMTRSLPAMGWNNDCEQYLIHTSSTWDEGVRGRMSQGQMESKGGQPGPQDSSKQAVHSSPMSPLAWDNPVHTFVTGNY